MSSLGIYFGPKLISIVETSGKKLVNNTKLLQTTVSTGELGEKVPTELKTIEIVALFKDELRKNKISAKEATLSLSGKDLIIRNFEIPVLPREELQGAVTFEAKKYLPFKVEELISDFQLDLDKVNRKNNVLFMGIKKETLERYISILNELNIKISAIEYSAFSLTRSLVLAGIGNKGIVALVGADLKEDDEVNFTVLENGFPVFSRDINLYGGPDEFGKAAEADAAGALEKLKTEIRVSLDYYHRKFPAKSIQKVYLVFNPEYRSDLETFILETGLSAQFLDVNKDMGKPVSYSLNLAKGYATSLSKVIKTKIKLDLLAVRARVRVGKGKPAQIDLTSLVKGIRVNPLVLVLGLAICAGVFMYGQYQTKPLKEELNKVINSQVKVSSAAPGATLNDLNRIDAAFKQKLANLDNLVKKQLYMTYPLDVIPKAIPDGVWLTNFIFKAGKDLNLKGMAYLGDTDKEFEAVNKFISNLKENPNFNNYFKDIKIVTVDRASSGETNVTNFSISCKTN